MTMEYIVPAVCNIIVEGDDGRNVDFTGRGSGIRYSRIEGGDQSMTQTFTTADPSERPIQYTTGPGTLSVRLLGGAAIWTDDEQMADIKALKDWRKNQTRVRVVFADDALEDTAWFVISDFQYGYDIQTEFPRVIGNVRWEITLNYNGQYVEPTIEEGGPPAAIQELLG